MIRHFRAEDINNIMQLWLDTNIQSHSFINRKYWQDNFVAVKEAILQATVYVCEQDGQIQAFIGLSGNYIAGLFVSKDFQSKGIGKLLLDYSKSKYNELTLHVYKKNDRALKFYLREKFSISESSIDENTGETELTMMWKS